MLRQAFPWESLLPALAPLLVADMLLAITPPPHRVLHHGDRCPLPSEQSPRVASGSASAGPTLPPAIPLTWLPLNTAGPPGDRTPGRVPAS